MSEGFIELRATERKGVGCCGMDIACEGIERRLGAKKACDDSTIYPVRLRITQPETMEFQATRSPTTLSSSQQLRE